MATPPIESNLPDPDALEKRVEHSRQAWTRAKKLVFSVTPKMLARFLLVAAVVVGLVWLVKIAWPAFLPFLVGGVLAYFVLPLVNWLDRLMPRFLAALASVLVVLIGIGMLLWTVLPLFISQTTDLAELIAVDKTIQALRDDLINQSQSLPTSIQAPLDDGIRTITDRLQENSANFYSSLLSISGILHLMTAIGFILGLIVLPTWLLVILKDQPLAKQSINKALAPGVRQDFWAVVKIIDRIFGAFFRGQVLIGLAVGLATYLGLMYLERLGMPVGPHIVTFAVLAGLFQLIPEVGPIVNTILAGILAYQIDPWLALYVLLLYLLIQFLVNRLMKDRIEKRIINVNPGLLILFIIALSQLGFLWLLLAAPLSGATLDLLRYAFGRLGSPPRPAGLLPGEPMPRQQPAGSSFPVRRKPMVYRRIEKPPD